ncbi:MAG: hypothetical protein DCC55_11095 [Chloroflexi bacterium]|nr:MAG: hypothetical protein DCC55_11095 [Chloroflexota bacterium]
MTDHQFTYRVTSGWLRDLAGEPTPHDRWPNIRWDEQLLADQVRFLDVQAELGMTYNLAWGFFIDRAWPAPFDPERVIDAQRREMLRAFVDAAHTRGLKILTGMGIYSWGFDEVIRQVPGVSAGHQHAMCVFSDEAWDWQRRVLDFVMEPRWGLDGLSMQSADQGRCECEKCSKLSPAEHHAILLVRSAEHVRANRPDWVIGQASWGLRVDQPEEFQFLKEISRAVDYMIEVRELSAMAGRRQELIELLDCAFGSVGGVFVEPPQHWDRLRWFVPCGLGSAQALARLWQDGGRACEYFYRPFANPVEEVSWRSGAKMLIAPTTAPKDALREAVAAVYEVTGSTLDDLTDWFVRGENAYFSRSTFELGRGPLSLEPLVWKENPAAAGPPIYLRDRMTAEVRADYAQELGRLQAELKQMRIDRSDLVEKAVRAIDGALQDIEHI